MSESLPAFASRPSGFAALMRNRWRSMATLRARMERYQTNAATPAATTTTATSAARTGYFPVFGVIATGSTLASASALSLTLAAATILCTPAPS